MNGGSKYFFFLRQIPRDFTVSLTRHQFVSIALKCLRAAGKARRESPAASFFSLSLFISRVFRHFPAGSFCGIAAAVINCRKVARYGLRRYGGVRKSSYTFDEMKKNVLNMKRRRLGVEFMFFFSHKHIKMKVNNRVSSLLIIVVEHNFFVSL